MHSPFRLTSAFAAAAVLAATGLCPSTVSAQLRNCTVAAQNLYVRDIMQDLYYWSAFVPNVNPTQYSSPEAYLDAVRYKPLDTTFSYITAKATSDAFYSSSQFVGFGLSTQTTSVEAGGGIVMRISQVFADSPASEAGLQRGDRVVAVGGRDVNDWWRSGQPGDLFGPATVGYATTVVTQRGDARSSARLAKRVVTIPTVSDVRIFDTGGVRVGYLFFRNFVEPSVAALDEAFARFQEAGVRELVLDLRYNGGGLVSVAEHLGSLIGGVRTDGQVFAEFVHNERNASLDRVSRFARVDRALTLERLFVITGRGSASASELVINGLRPFMPVVVVGDTTYGKPVGQYGMDFCDKTAYIVAFSGRNANQEGDYFGGIPPTCPAADDVGHPLGAVDEASLAETLFFLQNGTCSTAVSTTARVHRPASVVRPETGFSQLLGAH